MVTDESSPPEPIVRVASVDVRSTMQSELFIFAIGYESRSTHAAIELLGRYDRGLGIRFGVHEELSFEQNLAWAKSQTCVDIELSGSEVAAGEIVRAQLQDSPVQRVTLDVSSFPRPYLAAVIAAVWEHSKRADQDLDVTFIYSVPTFSPPPEEHGPVVSFGAVHPSFVGSPAGIRGLATLIGLGYEPELALSAQQVLDPAVTWLAVPRSVDADFDAEVASANDVLLNVVDDSNIWTYDIESPAATFYELEGVVAGLTLEHNVVLVPLGPKLFAVISMLVSLVHRPDVGVWRLSAGGLRIPKEQVAAGPIAGLAVHLSTRS